MPGGEFLITEDTLSVGLDDAIESGVMAEVEAHAVQLAVKILDYAKSNAPWQDRTGDARRLLDVDVSQDAEAITIQLYHQVDYGLWLEVIHDGEFAIIMPTLQHFANEAFTMDDSESGSGSGGSGESGSEPEPGGE
jgi:hypothetical protein